MHLTGLSKCWQQNSCDKNQMEFVNMLILIVIRSVQCGCLAFHGIKEIGIGLGGLEFVVHELHGSNLIHIMHDLA
jgi:hypothetical protein